MPCTGNQIEIIIDLQICQNNNNNRVFTSARLTGKRNERCTSLSHITVCQGVSRRVIIVKHDLQCHVPNTATNSENVNEQGNDKRRYDTEGSNNTASQTCAKTTRHTQQLSLASLQAPRRPIAELHDSKACGNPTPRSLHCASHGRRCRYVVWTFVWAYARRTQ